MYTEELIKLNEEKFIKVKSKFRWDYWYLGSWYSKSLLLEVLLADDITYQDWCDQYLLGISDPSARPTCPICGQVRSFDHQHRRYTTSCGNRSCAGTILMRDPNYRKIVSENTIKAYERDPSIKDRISNSLSEYRKLHPEILEEHSRKISARWKDSMSGYNTLEYRRFLSENSSKVMKWQHDDPNSALNDPTNKLARYTRMAQSLSRTLSDPKVRSIYSSARSKVLLDRPDILFNRYQEWITTEKGGIILVRSRWERCWSELLDKNPQVLSYKWEPFRIAYYYEYDRYYVPDVLVTYADHVELQEVKPEYLLYDEIVLAKAKAAVQWCNKNDAKFRFISYQEIFNSGITEFDYSILE